MNPYSWQSPYAHFGFGGRLTRTVKILIILNVAVFILIHLLRQFPWLSLFGLVPRYLFSKLMLWQLVTYMFLHAGLWHLVINMLMLWFFGPDLERAWGRRQFLSYYLFTGIGAGLCSFVTAFRSAIPVIGASGAIFGILVAYSMLFPEATVLLFFFFPMRIKQAVLLLAGINLLGALSNPGGGIAYFAHLGGGLFGFLYLKNEWIRRRIFYLSLSNLRLWWTKKEAKMRQPRPEDFNLDREVDQILDKISKYGMNSLSRREKKILETKSKTE